MGMKRLHVLFFRGIPALAGCLALLPCLPAEVTELGPFPVYAGSLELAGLEAGAGLSGRMADEVRVDLQTRGGTRYQTDVSIRGGIFEGSGLMVGGMTLFDPQTGHYFTEIPLSPAFFSGARLLTGVRNTLAGFNATAGSIDWQWVPHAQDGHFSVTGGTDAHLGAELVSGGELSGGQGFWQFGAMRSKGDGALEGSDFDRRQVSGRLEWERGSARLRVFGGYLDTFFGWPGMYTGFESLLETEDYQVALLGGQVEWGEGSTEHRIGGYWRRLDDDYEFNRMEPNALFEHQTEVWSLQGDGRRDFGASRVSYQWALLRDEVVSSTSLVNGPFRGRDYAEGAFLLERRMESGEGPWTVYGGIGLETDERHATVLSPIGGLRFGQSLAEGSWEGYVEYAESSQVPGYTALKSNPVGLFGGNPDLGRETARTLEGGFAWQARDWTAKAVAFVRRDEDLVDWVFRTESPSARQAAPMDATVTGLELWLGVEWAQVRLEMGYAYLDKDADYREAFGNASFYALNYARHRGLAQLRWRPVPAIRVDLRMEYRDQAANPLREGPEEAVFLRAAVVVAPPVLKGIELSLQGTNLGQADLELIPGTPGPGREVTASVLYRW